MSDSSIGVPIEGASKPGPMTFEEYDPNYPHVFAAVVAEIRKALPDAYVEHTGSTAVPGLGGRGMLDMVILADGSRDDEIVANLLRIGFIESPFAFVKSMLVGRIAYGGKAYPLLLYVLPAEHEMIRGFLAFRAYMQEHPEEAQTYAEVKRHVLAEGQVDARSYQDGKTPYLEAVAARIASGGYCRTVSWQEDLPLRGTEA